MSRYRAFACALLLALSMAPCLAAEPRASGQRLRDAIEADQPRAIALLERLVDQNSGTLNLPGVAAVGELVRAELEPLGFEVRWIDMRATGRAGHLIATHKGNGRGKRVLMIGHLDTVFEPDSPFQRFVREGDSATGPGIGDDKGGVVIIIAARAIARGDLRALTPEQDARARERMQAIVAHHLPKTDTTLVFEDAYRPMAPTAGNRTLLAMLNEVNAGLGLPAMGEWNPARHCAARR